MKFIPALFVLIYSGNLFSQDYAVKRDLLLRNAEGDTVIVNIKKDKTGEIIELDQHFLKEESANVYFMIEENYKKGKFWTLWRFKEIVKKKRKKSTSFSYILDGMQYQFNDQGKIIYIDEYDLGVLVKPPTEIIYYPNGALKYIAEFKDSKLLNILTYKFLNGEDYDFGNFKDGSGVIVHLNDEGKPCLECEIGKTSTRAKVLCDDGGY